MHRLWKVLCLLIPLVLAGCVTDADIRRENARMMREIEEEEADPGLAERRAAANAAANAAAMSQALAMMSSMQPRAGVAAFPVTGAVPTPAARPPASAPAPSASRPAKLAPMNHCLRTEYYTTSNGPKWRFHNNCSIPIDVAWCEAAGCRRSTNQTSIGANSNVTTFILSKVTQPGGILACGKDTFNTNQGDDWACWAKQR